MTWFKVDDAFFDHPKVMALEEGDHFAEAVALWSLAGAWCARHLTDGNVPRNALRRVTPFDAAPAAAELVRVGLWEEVTDGWRYKDWDEYQPLRKEVRERRENTRERVRRHRSKKRGGNGVTGGYEKRCPDPARPDPVINPHPPSSGQRPKDPLADHMAGRSPGNRDDVRQVYEAWKLAVDRPNAKLRSGHDFDAVTLAEAIDSHGLEDSLRVARYAPNDGMVSGKLDDKGREHKSIKYIFGNTDAFQRILHAARDRDRSTSRKKSAREAYEEAAKL